MVLWAEALNLRIIFYFHFCHLDTLLLLVFTKTGTFHAVLGFCVGGLFIEPPLSAMFHEHRQSVLHENEKSNRYVQHAASSFRFIFLCTYTHTNLLVQIFTLSAAPCADMYILRF